jgi:iron(III) transport system ATP-binding protein
MSHNDLLSRVGDGSVTARSTRQPTPESPDENAETVLDLRGLSRAYKTERAVAGVSLSVRDGELLTLLGPSGCGKTTMLRLLAGLERPSGGAVEIAGETVARADGDPFVPAEDRDVGLVFQDFALFPHLTVEENVAFGLQDWSRAERESQVDNLLELVDLTAHREKEPDALSGGQQQRVALARALAPEPDVLLLDEPFSNLDVRLRVEMREEVRDILKTAGVTAVSVTHDQEEALSISDRVAIMHDGQIEQVGTPEGVFKNPESRFVASFLGRASFLPGRVRGDVVETELGVLDAAQLNGPVEEYDGARIDVLLRPDDLAAVPANEATADGQVIRRQYTGPTFVYGVSLESNTTVRCLHNHAELFEHCQPVSVDITADHPLAWYPPRSG